MMKPAARVRSSKPRLFGRGVLVLIAIATVALVVFAFVDASSVLNAGIIYYVSPSGSDSNSGTSPSEAWKTVGRVNSADLQPGDEVLFQGDATFSDSYLEPPASGTASQPIIFGSYGKDQAILPLGARFVHNYLTFDNLDFGATFYGGSAIQGPSNDITLENSTLSLANGNETLGLFTNGDDWTIADNTINNTGLSGMLLNGNDYQITGNTITNTGLDTRTGYNQHGIYLDASDATITNNTITNFAESAVSVRYRNSTISGNYMAIGQIGIDFYQTDPLAGSSKWTDNTIADTTAADIYISPSGSGGTTHESFTITNNTLEKTSGVYLNLHATSGSSNVAGNVTS